MKTRNLRNHGFDIVVSMLTPEEMSELGLTREAELVREQGLEYFSYPIPDLGVPPSRESARNLLETLHRQLTAGKKVALHCVAALAGLD